MINVIHRFDEIEIHCPFCGVRFVADQSLQCGHFQYLVGSDQVLEASVHFLDALPDVFEREVSVEEARAVVAGASSFVEFDIQTAIDVVHVAFCEGLAGT